MLENFKMQAVSLTGNDRQRMQPSRKDHHMSSQGLSENSLKETLRLTLFLSWQS